MGTQGRVTLLDVAARAGVSTTTASYILNGRSAEMRISNHTERRVRAVAAELGYRPNRNARNLRTSRTSTIGVITDFVASGNFSSQMLAGASAAAREAEHLLVIGETEGDPEAESLLIEEMLERQVDGIVYATMTSRHVTVPAPLRNQRTVLLNCRDPRSDLPAWLPDDFEGGRSAVEVLLAGGIEEGIYLVGEDPTPGAQAGLERKAGIEARLGADGRRLAGVVACEWAVEPARDAVSRWLGAGARPSGLICLNDRIAMGVYEVLEERGLVVPDDVSIVSFDGSELAGWLRPRLTSVALPFVEMGAGAVNALLGKDGVGSGVTRVPMPVAVGSSVRARV